MHSHHPATPARCAIVWIILLLCCGSCASLRGMFSRPAAPPPKLEKITVARTSIPRRQELPAIIGHMQAHRIEPKETLLDVARAAGLGFNEVEAANRGVDEWIPPQGLEVSVPTQWILPRSRYRGMVINIAEMRLYFFPARAQPGDQVTVRTYAIGIGSEETPSPSGLFHVTAKEQHPTWYVPDSIYRTMDPPKRRVVPPGPDNPLGDYRMRLSKGLYSIHGTDVAWSVGRLTTHGCIRLYPEDISELYRLVPVGATGELVYEPVKFGESGGRIFVEVHNDIYKRVGNLESAAFTLARRLRVTDRIDAAQLRRAVREQSGAPVDVTRTRLAGGAPPPARSRSS